MSADLIHIVAASIERVSLALILALALAALWLSPDTKSTERRQRNLILLVALLLTLASAIADLVIRSAALADVSAEAWQYIPRVLSHSDYGTFWLFRVTIWAVMLATTLWIWHGRWMTLPSLMVLSGTMLTLLLISATSHAGEDGVLSLPNLINWLHLTSTSIWGGAVILYAMTVLPSMRQTSLTPRLARAATRLSTMATTALVFVLLTGIYNSWRQLTAIHDLWRTDYGRILSIKLLLVGGMLVIGTLNKFLLVPRLTQSQAQTTDNFEKPFKNFLFVLRIDSLIFIAVLIAAIILGMQVPPAHSGD